MIRVLVACEFSGVVRQAFRRHGCDAWSCDLLPAEDGSPYHLQGDVREYLHAGWELMIAHPPCTYLCNSGVRWLHEQPDRWAKMQEAVEFFLELWHAPIPRIAIENPIMHRYALQQVGRPTQIVHPWQFGDDLQKATGLWLKNLPPLLPTHARPAQVRSVHTIPPSPDRWKQRSRLSPYLAEAMAEQWLACLNTPTKVIAR